VAGRSYVDLSMPISPSMPTNEPDHFPPTITPYSTIEQDGWAGSEIRIDSHCGTHVDAPSHFVPGRPGVDALALDRLIGRAQRVDLAALSPSVRAEDLSRLDAGRVVVHTGWNEPLGRSEPPGHLEGSAAHALVDAGIMLVAIDAPSVDAAGVDEVHQILLGNGVVVVENLVGTGRLPDAFELIVSPLRIVDGDGSPARVVAIVADDS
jgi:kynurenine formamidase